MAFDWDYENVTHIALHGIQPEEVEEALLFILWMLKNKSMGMKFG